MLLNKCCADWLMFCPRLPLRLSTKDPTRSREETARGVQVLMTKNGKDAVAVPETAHSGGKLRQSKSRNESAGKWDQRPSVQAGRQGGVGLLAEEAGSVKLVAVGDISLQTRDGQPTFELIQQELRDKDILFGNLETALSTRDEFAEKAVVIVSPPACALFLKNAGFDVVNVANNHILDAGADGLYDTLEALERVGVAFVGAYHPSHEPPWILFERKGLRIGFLGYGVESRTLDLGPVRVTGVVEDEILSDVEQLKATCDVIVVSLHWGVEKVFYPSPKQIQMARRIIDAGASLILGHHPHVVQGVEEYRAGLIAYSLGNFQFPFDPAECLHKKTNVSLILKVGLSKHGIEGYELLPVEITDDWRPRVANRQTEREVRLFLEEISAPLRAGSITEPWWFEQIAFIYLSSNMRAWIIRIRKYGYKHVFKFIKWLFSPFVIKCYLGLVRRKLLLND